MNSIRRPHYFLKLNLFILNISASWMIRPSSNIMNLLLLFKRDITASKSLVKKPTNKSEGKHWENKIYLVFIIISKNSGVVLGVVFVVNFSYC